MIEKIKSELQELPHGEYVDDYGKGFSAGINAAIEIVQEVAKEYGKDTNVPSNGWIPCSERLPEEPLNSVLGWDEYRERCVFVRYAQGEWILGNYESVKIIAWQPLPAPYQKGE